jgi:hypothetical protein
VHTLLKCAAHTYDDILFAQNEHCSIKNNWIMFDLSPFHKENKWIILKHILAKYCYSPSLKPQFW